MKIDPIMQEQRRLQLPTGALCKSWQPPWTTTTKDPQMERWSSFKEDPQNWRIRETAQS